MAYSEDTLYTKCLIKNEVLRILYAEIRNSTNDQKNKIDLHFEELVNKGIILKISKARKCYKLSFDPIER